MKRRAWVLVVACLATLASCHRRRSAGGPPGARWTGPALGPRGATVRATRVLNPPRVVLAQPFAAVVAMPAASLGLAADRVYRHAADVMAPGGTLVQAFEPAHARVLAPAGGATVYALFEADRAFVAVSDDAGATWRRGAYVSEGRLPDAPAHGPVNREETPGIAAAGHTVVFWLGEQAAVSRDDGQTFAPLALGGAVRTLAVSRAGTVVATVRLTDGPDTDAMAVVRADATGVTPTVLAANDACGPGRAYALASGAVVLGGERGFLGLCARISRDDGRSFAPLAAATDASLAVSATPSGALVRRQRAGADGDPVTEYSTDTGATFTALPAVVAALPFDVASDSAVTAGTSDALLRLAPAADAATRATFLDDARRDVRSVLAYAAGRNALATLDGRGVVTLAEAHDGAIRVRTVQSPCRFSVSVQPLRELPLLALDGRDTLCCASSPATRAGGAACMRLSDAEPAWHALDPRPAAMHSGDGAIGLVDPGARCLSGTTAPADVAALGFGAETTVRGLSCAARGTSIAMVFDGPLGLLSPFALRTVPTQGRATQVDPAAGFRTQLLALANGTYAAAVETASALQILLYRANRARPSLAWSPRDAVGPPSVIAPWDDATAVLTLRNTLVVVSPAGIGHRPFANRETYDAVTRIGDTLVGVTREGRFAVLAAAR